MKNLEGKIAVITGGNSGIGLATAQRFVAEGAYVFITGRRQSELDAAVRQIGKNVTGVQSDVSNLEDLDRLYATVKQQKGRIDILFANAGVGEFAPLGAITEEHFDKTFDINVKGFCSLCKKRFRCFRTVPRSFYLLRPLHPKESRGSVFTAQPRPRYGRSRAPGQSI
jgi:NAD(P)-dependent dehydrogenase (short-subunit alcohol dehydrogenase family)